MESKKTSAAAAQPDWANTPFDLIFDNVKVSMFSSLPERQLVDDLLVPLNLTSFMQAKYQLKRKAVYEHGAVGKRLRDSKSQPFSTTEVSALLETEDFSAKLEYKNSILMKEIKSIQEIIKDETSTILVLGTEMEDWREEIIDSTRQNCDKALKEHELRKQLSELLIEYKSNKELMEESWSDATWCSSEWGAPIPMQSQCNRNLYIRVLGVQKLYEILDKRRAAIISKIVKLEKEMKDLGLAFI